MIVRGVVSSADGHRGGSKGRRASLGRRRPHWGGCVRMYEHAE